MAEPARIVVLGGGIAGLAAARGALLRGREAGRPVSVTILEKTGRLGGHVQTERADGFVLDAGPDSWVVTKPQASALARALGLEKDLVGTRAENRRFYIAWQGKLHPVPEGLVLGVPTRIGPLVTTRLFSWPGKLRMGLEPLVPVRKLEGDEDESIADFATRRLGREPADRLVAPLLGGISAGDASDISVRAAFPQLVEMERKHGSLVRGMRASRRARAKASSGAAGAREGSAFVSLAGGVGTLVTALIGQLRADGVSVRTDAAVQSLARAGSGWEITLTQGERLAADAVVLALPAYAARSVLGHVDERLDAALGSIRYGSTATVFLGYRAVDVSHPLDGVGFVVPRSAGRPVLASTWVSSKWAGRAPEGHVLLRVFVGGASGEAALSGADDALVETARRELRVFMGIEADPVLTRVFRFPSASAQMRVGHLATMRAVHERLAALGPHLRIAGGGYDGVGIPDCIRQGEEAGAALATVAPTPS